MSSELAGREIILSPLRGESEFREDLKGRILGMVERKGLRETFGYFFVELSKVLQFRHPAFERKVQINRVLVMPDGTQLEWGFFGGGPPSFPVLVKVFGVHNQEGTKVTDFTSGETFLLARAVARPPSNRI